MAIDPDAFCEQKIGAACATPIWAVVVEMKWHFKGYPFVSMAYGQFR
jgi:hypothetical protein